MITVVTTFRMKPYMVSRCEIRRFWLQNSDEVRTTDAAVSMASDRASPLPTWVAPLSFDRRMLSKKYLALPL